MGKTDNPKRPGYSGNQRRLQQHRDTGGGCMVPVVVTIFLSWILKKGISK